MQYRKFVNQQFIQNIFQHSKQNILKNITIGSILNDAYNTIVFVITISFLHQLMETNFFVTLEIMFLYFTII